MGADGAYFNLRRVVVPEGCCPADEAVRRVHRTVLALECLRTRFPVEGGRPRQVVDGEGELGVTLVDVPADEVDAAVAATTRTLRAHPIDTARSWPARFGVVTAGGRCRAVVVVVSHLAVDAAGLDVLAAVLRTGEVPAGGWQPCDQAAMEATPKEQRRSALNVARWTGLLAGLDPPAGPVPDPSPDDTRFAEWSMVSGPVRRDAQELARRCEVSYSSAVLAAVVAVLGRRRGRPDVALTLISRNRSRPREQGYAGPLAQDALFRVGWDGGAPAAEFVRSVHRQAVAAYAGGRYDPDRLREQGVAKVPWFFNDARSSGSGSVADRAGSGPDAEVVEQIGSWPYLDLRCFVTLQDAGDRARLRVVLDTRADPEMSGPQLLRAVSRTASLLAAAPQWPLSILQEHDPSGSTRPRP